MFVCKSKKKKKTMHFDYYCIIVSCNNDYWMLVSELKPPSHRSRQVELIKSAPTVVSIYIIITL